MADLTNRIRKRAAHLLDPSEMVIAALLVEPKGTYGAAIVAIAALPRASVRKLRERAEHQQASEGGLAASFPSMSSLLVVTDRRVLVVPSNGISMKEVAAVYDRADMRVAENTGKGLGRRLVLAFVDGTSVTLDAQRGQPFDDFTAAVGFSELVRVNSE